MKQLLVLILVLFHFTFIFSQSQEKDKITEIIIGTRFPFPNDAIEDSIADGKFNFYDSFEYEFLTLFSKYAERHHYPTIHFKELISSERENFLNRGKVDAVISSVSITNDRIDKGFVFSRPYFSNKSIVLISNNSNIDVRKLDKGETRIGYIKNTTAYDELRIVKSKYPNIDLGDGYGTFGDLMQDLKDKKIDAIAGDLSRLSYYLINDNLYFAGNLPTKKAQIEDKYGVFSKRPEIIPFFNRFIVDNKSQIKELNTKWFSNIDNIYQDYYSRSSFSFRTLLYSLLGLAILFLLTIAFFLRKVKKINKEKEAIQERQLVDGTAAKVSGILQAAFNKFQDKLEPEDIVKTGIDFFETAKEKVTYIGSGGFLSDKKYGRKWKEAIHNSLNRGIVIDRIIDLPEICFSDLRFKNMNYFHPETSDRDYVKKYLKWLLLQYIDLTNFGSNYRIHNSRGASLWGYGIAIMIKDNSEVLLYTTNQKEKIGSLIVNKELAIHFSKLMNVIKNIGKDIDEEDLEREFFSGENNLKSLIAFLKNEKEENNSIELTQEINDKIEDITNILNKRFNKKNNIH